MQVVDASSDRRLLGASAAPHRATQNRRRRLATAATVTFDVSVSISSSSYDDASSFSSTVASALEDVEEDSEELVTAVQSAASTDSTSFDNIATDSSVTATTPVLLTRPPSVAPSPVPSPESTGGQSSGVRGASVDTTQLATIIGSVVGTFLLIAIWSKFGRPQKQTQQPAKARRARNQVSKLEEATPPSKGTQYLIAKLKDMDGDAEMEVGSAGDDLLLGGGAEDDPPPPPPPVEKEETRKWWLGQGRIMTYSDMTKGASKRNKKRKSREGQGERNQGKANGAIATPISIGSQHGGGAGDGGVDDGPGPGLWSLAMRSFCATPMDRERVLPAKPFCACEPAEEPEPTTRV